MKSIIYKNSIILVIITTINIFLFVACQSNSSSDFSEVSKYKRYGVFNENSSNNNDSSSIRSNKNTNKNHSDTNLSYNRESNSYDNLSSEYIDTDFSNSSDFSNKKINKKSVSTKKNKKLTSSFKFQTCKNILNKYQPSYKKLTKYYQNIPEDIKIFLSYKEKDCSNHYNSIFLLSKKILVKNTNKLGIILPLSGDKSSIAHSILFGIDASRKDLSISNSTFIIKDSMNDSSILRQKIAELILKDRVSILMVENSTYDDIAGFTNNLNIPVILLNSKGKYNYPHVFNVFPKEESLLDTLVKKMVKSGFKKVALLRSVDNNSNFLEGLTTKLKEHNIKVVQDISYSSSNYDTMEIASKTLFQIDPIKRQVEYAMLMNEERMKAYQEKTEFNPSKVSLSPIKDFDAVIIPDNFKIVRHFSNIFKYLGVHYLPIIGNYELRSYDLLYPFDYLLEGSFFVDFIGKYTDLPKSLDVKLDKSEFFTLPSEIQKIDYSIIGYHSMWIVSQIMNKNLEKKRLIFSYLKNMKISNSSYFKTGYVFDKNNEAIWPTFLLTVHKQNFLLESY